MSKRGVVITALLVAVAAGAGFATKDHWWPERASAQTRATPPERVVPVTVAQAVRKSIPVRLEALGNVQPMASVAIKARVETVITEVLFSDGAAVKHGDVLFKLDSRAVEAQIRQVEGVLVGAQAQLAQAERDLKRYTELFARNATTQVNVNNAQTQVNLLQATVKSSTANLDNLKVQLDYHTIRAPISGRMSAALVKVGNFVRPADTAPLATIVQIKPVYVTFGVPQRSLPDVRRALNAGTSQVEAMAPGEVEPSVGKLAMVDNTVDVTTGMIAVRALMENEGEQLWPGTLVNVGLTLRMEEAVSIPSVAVQTGQSGTFVFVVKDGRVSVRPIKVERTVAGDSVVAEGLSGGEIVVTDGQLLLANGTKVAPRKGGAAGA
jgi:RND family efflux transporter MFP subunit